MGKNRRGVSLVEMIVAMVLLAVVVMGALEYIVYCARFVAIPQVRLEAVNFARAKLEELCMDPRLNDYPINPSPGPENTPNDSSGAHFSLNKPQYSLGGPDKKIDYLVVDHSFDIDAERTDYEVVTASVQWD